MHALSKDAGLVLDRMEADRRYDAQELHALVPDASVERVREIMHELWIQRQVERVGYAGWRRQRSAQPHRSDPVAGEIEAVKPEDLFDHDAFADFFK